ncbi:MAG: Uncharacterized protein XD91_1587 [Clostridiales bacterium 38_11]|nr:MAG: Uncharacterized protein XD91_1587 [Clostridiales bacterium 38_11]HBH13016.1 hypothetical protein [Clostridiales bacterium]
MIKYMQKHEESMMSFINSETYDNWNALIDYHKTQIEFIQHERLIHLIITIGIAIILSILFGALMLFFNSGMLLIILMLIVMEVFYIIHYYKLENGVQRWYEIYKTLILKSKRNEPLSDRRMT